MKAHKVETFIEDQTGALGWQCFTCGVENVGFETWFLNEASADHHRENA